MAVTNFTGNVGVSANFRYTTTVNGSSVVVSEAQPTTGAARRFTSSMIDLPYVTTGTLAFSATADIDLSATGFSTIKFVAVFLTSTTGKLKIGGTGPSNINVLWFADSSDAMTIEQGGPPFLQGSSTAVTVDATHKNFRLTNTHASESATYEVWVWGVD